MPITESRLVYILPNARPVAGVFVPALNRAMSRCLIDNPDRQAAFIAQIGHESAQLTRLVENLNYSAEGLAATWPSRYQGEDGQPNALAKEIERQPEPIANHTYADRNGNGSIESGDGWRYRGRGLIMITGRANYSDTAAGVGQPFEQEPALLEQAEWAAMSAAWWWEADGLNDLADAGEFEAISKKINGGLNGQADREELWERAKEVIV